MMKPILSEDPWQQLKAFTAARIALGRVGTSLPTREILNFGAAHALARDAVHRPLNVELMLESLTKIGFETQYVRSQASSRAQYLLRPDFGRRLNQNDAQKLKANAAAPIDVLFVIGDGLSSIAVERHVMPLLNEVKRTAPNDWHMNTGIVATQARVALGDEIGELLQAKIVVMLIGERPGLSAPDSLGVYLTYAPKVGSNDAQRNCISNVRPEGLSYTDAAHKLLWLIKKAMQIQATGVVLKDESVAQNLAHHATNLIK